MTKENKELLIRDLCSRLPYGVKISVNNKINTLEGIHIPDGVVEFDSCLSCNVEQVKPYLFPLSSMTEEEKVIYGDLCYSVIHSLAWDTQAALNELVDWLNEHHFDYRGLIEKDLPWKHQKKCITKIYKKMSYKNIFQLNFLLMKIMLNT